MSNKSNQAGIWAVSHFRLPENIRHLLPGFHAYLHKKMVPQSGVPPGAHVGQVIHHPDNLTSKCTASPNKRQKEE